MEIKKKIPLTIVLKILNKELNQNHESFSHQGENYPHWSKKLKKSHDKNKDMLVHGLKNWHS